MHFLRSTVAGALAGTASLLSLTSRVLEVTADALRGAESTETDLQNGAGTGAPAPPRETVDGELGAVGHELTDEELGLVPTPDPTVEVGGDDEDESGFATASASPADEDAAPGGLSTGAAGTAAAAAAPAGEMLPDDAPHLRTSASHIEDLGMQSAAAVVAAVADLSTDELRLLNEYETAHRGRKTVLQAIERALSPR